VGRPRRQPHPKQQAGLIAEVPVGLDIFGHGDYKDV